MRTILFLLSMVLSIDAYATNDWRYGTVRKIIALHNDGSFMLLIDNDDIKTNCLHQRVNFEVSDLGTERTRTALSMAMTALVSGVKFGLVLDVPLTPNALCSVPVDTSQGASIGG